MTYNNLINGCAVLNGFLACAAVDTLTIEADAVAERARPKSLVLTDVAPVKLPPHRSKKSAARYGRRRIQAKADLWSNDYFIR